MSISQFQYSQMLERLNRKSSSHDHDEMEGYQLCTEVVKTETGLERCKHYLENGVCPVHGRVVDEQREVGRGGLQDQVEQWLRQNEHSLKIMWTRNRTDKPSSCELARPDYVGCIQGRCWAVEVKRKGQKPTLKQQGELLRWKMSGAITGIAHTLDEFIEILL